MSDAILIRPYEPVDLPIMTALWNTILEAGNAFPGEEFYQEADFAVFLSDQTSVRCLLVNGKNAGYYILHPNNIGRCSHTANASYLVDPAMRGLGIGEKLVADSLKEAKEKGFRGMQFNAVVSENHTALHIYRKLGFTTVGTIPGGFRVKDGRYVDMFVMYHPL